MQSGIRADLNDRSCDQSASACAITWSAAWMAHQTSRITHSAANGAVVAAPESGTARERQ
jgi:hypothetical protein